MPAIPSSYPPGQFVSSTIAAAQQAVVCRQPNSRAATIGINGTWSGTLAFYYSVDDVTWQPAESAFPLGGGAPAGSTTANGTWTFSFGLPNSTSIAVVATAWTSGTADIAINLA